jgi:hypothetical protein
VRQTLLAEPLAGFGSNLGRVSSSFLGVRVHLSKSDLADFLSAANPDKWPQSATRPMMEAHIDTTTVYSVDLLNGDYAAAVEHYDEALEHMIMLADTLSAGIIAQFPDQFS